jgi:aspartyl-tRNA(Asn)/glutamyl-tRNA(Gln) amidotransferase subunit A
MSMKKPPLEIWRAAPRICAGDLHPIELLEACLERILRDDERVQAWAAVDADRARAEAHRAADEIAAGRYLGPLHGIPLGIKDIVDVQGFPTRAGSELTSGSAAACDAPVVARLRSTGAILLGKTVTTEFASFDPAPTRNPWNLEHTPGGSSSGSAAAVAAGMCLGAVGSQTGGSITRPAAYCGVASCKPTFARLELEGVVPFSQHLDHLGVLARCVADLVYVLDGMALDWQLIFAFAARLRSDSAPHLGLLDKYFMEDASEPVIRVTRDALRVLRGAGASVTLASLPEGFDEVHAMHRRVMAYEAAQVHRQRYTEQRDRLGPQLALILEEGVHVSAQAYEAALAQQRRFQTAAAARAEDFDALVTPATPTTAPAGHATTGDPRFNSPWTYSGLPTVSFPCGFSDEGLPVALQLIGRQSDEAHLLAIAAWCERQLEVDNRLPMLRDGD